MQHIIQCGPDVDYCISNVVLCICEGKFPMFMLKAELLKKQFFSDEY